MTAMPDLLVPAREDTPDAADRTAMAAVQEVVRSLDRAIRAFQLYEGNHSSYRRFPEQLRAAFQSLWQELPSLTLEVREGGFYWEGQRIYEGQHRPADLAFLFYRDGILELSFHPGFEDEELGVFLSLLTRVQRVRDEHDDLITLLWDHDLPHLEYRHIELVVDGLPVWERSAAPPLSVDPAQLRAEIHDSRRSASREASDGTTVSALATEFRESPYLLEAAEMRRLQQELQSELGRDLMRDVLNGLLDRLQDGDLERRQRILRILADLLPALIRARQFGDALLVLREVAGGSFVSPLPEREVRALVERLGEPGLVQEVVRAIEDTPGPGRSDEHSALLGFFPASVLEALIVAAQAAERPEVRRVLFEGMERVAAADPARLIALLPAESAPLATGAALLAGRLRLEEAAPALVRLLANSAPQVRLAAVGAIEELRSPAAAGALCAVLEDPQREVRIAAARSLGALRFAPARAALEQRIQSRQVREADISERLAMFEAYGSVAGAEGVELLDRLLNGRGWLGRREPAEIRASAALALARTEHPRAKQVLTGAAHDGDPVVRAAVARALRTEGA
jgi:hypothetical protein